MKLKKKFPKKLAEKTLKEIIDFLKYEKFLAKQKVVIGIKNLSQAEIKKLNNEYRKKNEPTDILSFGYEFNDKILEGDLILCWEVIQKNAQEDGAESEQELKKNLIHGCLHLIGKKHSREMFKVQTDFLKL